MPAPDPEIQRRALDGLALAIQNAEIRVSLALNEMAGVNHLGVDTCELGDQLRSILAALQQAERTHERVAHRHREAGEVSRG